MEEKQWELRGHYIPANVWELVRDGDLNAGDLFLISIIDQLTKHQGKDKDGNSIQGMGCYAGADFLGKVTKEHPKAVIRRISKLKSSRLKILVEIHLQGQRILELSWARTALELNKVQGEYGILLRQAHKKLAMLQLPDTEEGNNSVTEEGNNSVTEEGNNSVTEEGNNSVTIYNTQDIAYTKYLPPAAEKPLWQEDKPKKNFPSWISQIGKQLHEFIKTRVIGFDAGTLQSRKEAIYQVWKDSGENDNAQNTLVSLINFFIEQYDNKSLNLPRTPMGFPTFLKSLPWIASEKEKFEKKQIPKRLHTTPTEDCSYAISYKGTKPVIYHKGKEKITKFSDNELYTIWEILPKELRDEFKREGGYNPLNPDGTYK